MSPGPGLPDRRFVFRRQKRGRDRRAGARFDREFVRAVFREKEGREPTEAESWELGEQFEEIKVLHHEEAVDFFEQLRREGAIDDPLIADTPLEFYQLRGHGSVSGGLFWPL